MTPTEFRLSMDGPDCNDRDLCEAFLRLWEAAQSHHCLMVLGNPRCWICKALAELEAIK